MTEERSDPDRLAPEPSTSPPSWVPGALATLAIVLGALLLADGLARGETRHRLVGAGLGALVLVGGLAGHARQVPRLARPIRGLGLAAASTLATLVVVEVTLRVFGHGPLRDFTFIPSAELGHTVAPGDGVDARGFFNPEALERADVVCIGDSQTAGVRGPGVRYSDQLAQRASLAVYNMSQGGYGPGQYAVLVERALELHPRRIVVGFYFGNDLLDAHLYARLPGRESTRDPRLRYHSYPHLIDRRGEPRNLGMGLVDALVERTSLGSRVADVLRGWMKGRFGIAYQEPDGPRVRAGPLATRLTPNYRLRAVDLERVPTRDGLRLTRLALEGIRDACSAAGVEVLLLWLPTKEYCYAQLAERGVVEVQGLERLAQAERRVREALREVAEGLALPILDPTEPMLEALAGGRSLWGPTSDGHFTEAGHDLLAGLLHEHLGVQVPPQDQGIPSAGR